MRGSTQFSVLLLVLLLSPVLGQSLPVGIITPGTGRPAGLQCNPRLPILFFSDPRKTRSSFGRLALQRDVHASLGNKISPYISVPEISLLSSVPKREAKRLLCAAKSLVRRCCLSRDSACEPRAALTRQLLQPFVALCPAFRDWFPFFSFLICLLNAFGAMLQCLLSSSAFSFLDSIGSRIVSEVCWERHLLFSRQLYPVSRLGCPSNSTRFRTGEFWLEDAQ